jgi:CP family cyanate transporter-like MFS transporter
VTATDRPLAPVARRPVVLLLALLLVALNLRPAIASVPPLLSLLQSELGLSGVAAGLLTTLPVLCMSMFAPAGAALARRLGRERALSVALGLVAAGTLVRGAAPAAPALFAGQVLAGAGIAMAGTLLPGLVKAYFPGRPGVVTGLYTAALAGGAMAAAGGTVPLLDLFGGRWQLALATWTALALAGLAVWIPVTAPITRRGADQGGARPERGRLPWRSGTAWRVSVFMGGQSLLYYSVLTWLAPRYTALGWSKASAGLLLALFSAVQVASAVVMPALSDRSGDRRPWIALCASTATVTLTLVAVTPSAAPVLWAGGLGLAVGGQFALALSLLVDLSPDPASAERLSGMAFLIGYLLAAVGPVLAGALHDASGGFRLPFLVLAGVAVATMAVGVSIRPARQR